MMTPTEHYRKTFHIQPALNESSITESFHIRYQVYCREFGYEQLPEGCPELETDEYDDRSRHCLLIHNRTGRPVGCARLVMQDPDLPGVSLPCWEHCRHAFDTALFDPESLRADQLVEFSRVAIIEEFRRREKAELRTSIPVLEQIHERRYSTFQVIPVCLFLAALAMFVDSDAEFGVAMMEPKLVRLLRKCGIYFESVGHVVNYHGLRAPYVIFRDDVRRQLPGEVRELFDEICRQWRGGSHPARDLAR